MVPMGGGGMSDGFLEVAYVSPSLMAELQQDLSDHINSGILTIHLYRKDRHDVNDDDDDDDDDDDSFTSLVVQVVSSEFSLESCRNVVMLHPLLCNYLYQVVHTDAHEVKNDDIYNIDHACLAAVAPLPLMEFHDIISNITQSYTADPLWRAHPIQVEELHGDDCQIHLSCIYAERYDTRDTMEHHNMATAIQGRILKKGCIVLLSTLRYGHIIARVTNIIVFSSLSQTGKPDVSYKVRGEVACVVDPPLYVESTSDPTATEHLLDNDGVPGYEDLQKELLDIFRIHPTLSNAAVSGILLTGCSGVGKTRLALGVARLLREKDSFSHVGNTTSESTFKLYYMSVQDLIFQASSDPNLLQTVLRPNLRDCSLWILDDLHLLEMDSEEEGGPSHNVEFLLVRNALLEAIDGFHRQCRIIGISQNEQKLPKELTKIGRLEKCIQMLPPAQAQRTEIWKSILKDGPSVIAQERSMEWAKALTVMTPGCVARDLIRAYQDARTTTSTTREKTDTIESQCLLEWERLKDAVKVLIPSQLAELDVIKPVAFESTLNDKQIHAEAFRNFSGYSRTKKHLYGHVVSPWKHFLRGDNATIESRGVQSWLKPPPGVLFHGRSGTGKTEAAWCLATSLQLPVIQVRAADILNKWLGGSESLLRSLFAKARSASPCILFLDEIDSLAGNRDEDETNDYSSRILSTLLNEMDGVSTSIDKSQVLVLAATNRLGSLDSALLRPGRLQEHVFMDTPSIDDLEDMLKKKFEHIPMDANVELRHIASVLYEKGATGADVNGLCREVCMMAMRGGCEAIDSLVATHSNFQDAIGDHFNVDIPDVE